MKVLVIGSGGREHAIIDKLSESSLVTKIYAAPGNDGFDNCELVNIKVDDIDSLLKFALDKKIDLTVVGPEASLAAGVVDLFLKNNLKIFGPTKAASQIECSKDFAKNLMKKYNIPTASFATFTSFELAKEYLDKHGVPIVVKYDGLAQGKGVVVAKTYAEAIDALKDMLIDDKFGQAKVVLEDYLEGPEFSFMCFVDGDNVYPLELAQDHKRSFDFDKGLNTGGMGAYSPLKFITKDDIDYSLNKIMKPVAKALVEENRSFTGVLYGGLMKTVEGIKVIEFNARFGDPETEVVLPRLTSDLCQNFLDVIDHKNVNLKWSDEVCIGIVMASKGYPQAYIKGAHIGNLDKVSGKVYYMGVCKKDNQIYTNGGRVLIVVEKGSDLLSARNKALEDCKKIECSNLFYRTDIGHWSI